MKRPLAVTILGCVYIVTGAVSVAHHFSDLYERDVLQSFGVWAELVALIAIVCGAFLLRGHNWARWLAVAWMAFHVIVSAFHTLSQFAIHLLFCLVIAWILFRPDAAQYFRGARVEPS